MRFAVVLLVLTFAAGFLHACTCDGGVPLCQRLRTNTDRVLFVGKANSVWHEAVSLNGMTITQQVTTFLVQKSFAASTPQTITVRAVAPSMCGFRFKQGEIYLVDAVGRGSDLNVNACGVTAPAKEAQDAIRLLQTLHEGRSGALIFGTVKQYVGKHNFVALANRPVPDLTVTLESEGKSRSATVDESGWYEFTELPAGQYTVSVSLPKELNGISSHIAEVFENGCSQVDFRASSKGD